MNDSISRQDAVNTIKRYKHRLDGKGQTYGFLLEEFEHQIPSAKPTGDLINRADALKPFCIAPDGTRIPEVDCDNFPVEFSVEFIKKHLLSLPSAEATIGDYPNDLISRSALMEYCSNQKSKSIDNNDIARFPSVELANLKQEFGSAEAEPTMTEEVREALMRLTMCAREECGMCKYKDECGFDFQYKISTDNMNTLADALLRSKCEVDAKSAEAVQGWIPFTRRPMTEEEQKEYPNCTFMFDCVLPEDGDEILVSNGRFVWMDTFCNDIDGCYLDSGDDIDEDMAWMPLPKPYKGGEDE